MEKFNWKNQQGFSLIEVIVAMVLITTVGAAFSSFFFTGTKATVKNERRLEGIMIGQDLLEEIRVERDNGRQSIPGFSILLQGKGMDSLGDDSYSYVLTRKNIEYHVEVALHEDIRLSDLMIVDISVEAPDINRITMGTKLFLGR